MQTKMDAFNHRICLEEEIVAWVGGGENRAIVAGAHDEARTGRDESAEAVDEPVLAGGGEIIPHGRGRCRTW